MGFSSGSNAIPLSLALRASRQLGSIPRPAEGRPSPSKTLQSAATKGAETHEKGYCGRSDEASEVPDLYSEENRFHWVARRQQKKAFRLWESSVRPASE